MTSRKPVSRFFSATMCSCSTEPLTSIPFIEKSILCSRVKSWSLCYSENKTSECFLTECHRMVLLFLSKKLRRKLVCFDILENNFTALCLKPWEFLFFTVKTWKLEKNGRLLSWLWFSIINIVVSFEGSVLFFIFTKISEFSFKVWWELGNTHYPRKHLLVLQG